jgi:transposase InsO family protein
MAQALGISRSGYYKHKQAPLSKHKRRNQELIPRIHSIFHASRQEYGARRVKKSLAGEGIKVGLKRIGTLMKNQQLIAKAGKKFKVTTKQSVRPYHTAPNLLQQNFKAVRPNQAWVGDITYVPTQEGWLYLATVIDLFSRKVVGLGMSQHLTQDLVLRAMVQAVQRRKPPKGLIFHSDRGSQYTSKAMKKLAEKHGIHLSMSSTGNCYDNAVAESFFHTLKIAVVHKQSYATRNQAMRCIFEYIEVFYNQHRMHSTLGYLSPTQFEEKWLYYFTNAHCLLKG